MNYMAQIEPDEIASMEFGQFPSIEALAFAVTEIRQYVDHDADYDDGDSRDPWQYDPFEGMRRR
ncbi:MAG: hypothetical protein H8E73_10550 [Planctomycetes bacterium]|nr:hypothetical protein [Planctomycetota bacterium]